MASCSPILPLLSPFDNILMLIELISAWTVPSRCEFFALTIFAIPLSINLVMLIGVFAAALKVLWSVDGEVGKVPTMTTWHLTLYMSLAALQKIVIFIVMVTETLGGWANNLALQFLWVAPRIVHSVSRHGCIVLFILLVLSLIHEFPTVITHQVAIFYVSIDVFIVALASDGEFVALHTYYNLFKCQGNWPRHGPYSPLLCLCSDHPNPDNGIGHLFLGMSRILFFLCCCPYVRCGIPVIFITVITAWWLRIRCYLVIIKEICLMGCFLCELHRKIHYLLIFFLMFPSNVPQQELWTHKLLGAKFAFPSRLIAYNLGIVIQHLHQFTLWWLFILLVFCPLLGLLLFFLKNIVNIQILFNFRDDSQLHHSNFIC